MSFRLYIFLSFVLIEAYGLSDLENAFVCEAASAFSTPLPCYALKYTKRNGLEVACVPPIDVSNLFIIQIAILLIVMCDLLGFCNVVKRFKLFLDR